MANEVTQALSHSYNDGTTLEEMVVPATQSSPATTRPLHATQLATTSIAALNLGPIATPGLITIRNLDATNYVDVYTAVSSGKAFARLQPGMGCQVPPGPDGLAPAVQAHTASCVVEYMVTAA